jgi:excinuclease ABC subunit A
MAPLNPAALAVTVGDKKIHEVTHMSIDESLAFFKGLKLDEEKTQIAHAILKEIHHRLKFLADVGLNYITLDRTSATLSGGEAQRLKLAAAMHGGGTGVLYIFDEPTTGLHFSDVSLLLACFEKLVRADNTVLVVEHNMDVVKCADWVIDLGPEGGEAGGHIVAQGTPDEVARAAGSHTALYLARALTRESVA